MNDLRWTDLGDGLCVRQSAAFQMNSTLLLDPEHSILVDPGVLPSEIDEIAAPTLKKVRPARFANGCKHQIPACFDVERGDNQLPESGLSEVLQQKLGVAAAEIVGGRLFRRCGTAE